MSVIKTYYRDDKEVVENYLLTTMSWDLKPDGVLLITFTSPVALNPMTFAWVSEIFFCLEHAERLKEVKVVVLTGSGRAFSAGASVEMLKVLSRGDKLVPDDYVQAMGQNIFSLQKGYDHFGKGQASHFPDIALHGLTRRFLSFPKILVCAINGLAVGGAANISLLLADFTFTCPSSKFMYPFANRGVPPELSSSVTLAATIGLPQAKRLLMLGDTFDGQECQRLGLTYRHVSNDADLLPEAMSFASKQANDPTLPGKELVKQSLNRRVLESLAALQVCEKENLEFVASTKTNYFRAVTFALLKKFAKL